MGIDTFTAKFLHDYELVKGNTLTLGRQALFGDNSEYAKVLGISIEQFITIRAKSDGLCEGLLEHLGATKIDSLDYSNYEGATIIHDLNKDVSYNLLNEYDTVLDSGTLEHIFNYPIALFNCMKMVNVNGLLILITPTNNLCNHGFYQISPELIFRVFTNKNGFKLLKCFLRVSIEDSKIIELEDKPGIRNEIDTSMPSYMYVVAKKLNNVDALQSNILQSDYVKIWDKANG